MEVDRSWNWDGEDENAYDMPMFFLYFHFAQFKVPELLNLEQWEQYKNFCLLNVYVYIKMKQSLTTINSLILFTSLDILLKD